MGEQSVQGNGEERSDPIPDEVENRLRRVRDILRSHLVDVDEAGAREEGVADPVNSEPDEDHPHRNSDRSEQKEAEGVGTDPDRENRLESDLRKESTQNGIHHDFTNLPDCHGRQEVGTVEPGLAQELRALHEVNRVHRTDDQGDKQEHRDRRHFQQGKRVRDRRSLGLRRKRRRMGETEESPGTVAEGHHPGPHHRLLHFPHDHGDIIALEERGKPTPGHVRFQNEKREGPTHQDPPHRGPETHVRELATRILKVAHRKRITDRRRRHEHESEGNRQQQPCEKGGLRINGDLEHSADHHENSQHALRGKTTISELDDEG